MKIGNLAVPGDSNLLAMGNAGDLYKEVAEGTSQAIIALRVFEGSQVTMWAPSENRHLQFLLSAIMDTAVTQAFEVTVHILAPRSPSPSCYSPDALLGLWTHPSLSKKWKDIWK